MKFRIFWTSWDWTDLVKQRPIRDIHSAITTEPNKGKSSIYSNFKANELLEQKLATRPLLRILLWVLAYRYMEAVFLFTIYSFRLTKSFDDYRIDYVKSVYNKVMRNRSHPDLQLSEQLMRGCWTFKKKPSKNNP